MTYKESFGEKYPYIVYTDKDTIVYSGKIDTSVDDIGEMLVTATVTISNATSGQIGLALPCIVEEPAGALSAVYVSEASGEEYVSVALYKGTAIAQAVESLEGVLVEVEGDIEYNDNGGFFISGDGSISFATIE